MYKSQLKFLFPIDIRCFYRTSFLPMKKEVWKELPGYEGRYFLSDQGRVKSIKPVIINGIDCGQREKILRLTVRGHGRTTVRLNDKTLTIPILLNEVFGKREDVLHGELWRDVPGFQKYQVSDQGRVRSSHGTGRILKMPLGKDGHPTVTFRRDGVSVSLRVCKIVAVTFSEADLDYRNVAIKHLNGDRLDNSFSNLSVF